MNNLKREIEQLTNLLADKKLNAGQASDILDDEQYRILGELKQAKMLYRQKFAALCDAKASMHPARQLVVEAQQNLLEAFEAFRELQFAEEQEVSWCCCHLIPCLQLSSRL